MDRVYIAGFRWQSNSAQRIVFFVAHVRTPRLVGTRMFPEIDCCTNQQH
jgi:hypothetical protein